MNNDVRRKRNRTKPPDRFRRLRKIVLWGLVACALVTATLFGLLIWGVQTSFGQNRTLDDFDSAAEAITFVSHHLPTSLPADSRIEQLTYQRWTDWHLRAEVTLPGGTEQMLEDVRRTRAPEDSDCPYNNESGSVSFYLPDEHACGAVTALGDKRLLVTCFTR